MGDFPVETAKTVHLSDLIHRAVDKSYEDLHALTRNLQHESNEGRREALLSYLRLARQRFLHILILVKWSVQSPLLEKCDHLLEKVQYRKNQLNETNDRMFFLHADLNRAKQRIYDLPTAIDVLFGGSYLRLPTLIENAMYPRPLSPVKEEVADQLNDILSFRLLDTEIPKQFSFLSIENGFLTCKIDKEFTIVLTVQGKDDDSKWRVVEVSSALEDIEATSSPEALKAIQATIPSKENYLQLKSLVQHCLNVSSQPLVKAFEVVRDFCSCLALEILYSQGKALERGKWKDMIKVIYHRTDYILDFYYWCGHAEAELTPSGSTLVNFLEGWMCLRMAMCSSPADSLLSFHFSPKFPPGIGNHHLLRSNIMDCNGLVNLSAEKLLLGGMQAHAACSLYSLKHKLTIEMKDFQQSTETKLISGEKVLIECDFCCLKITRKTDFYSLHDDYSLVIAIDLRTGSFIVSSPANKEEQKGRLNQALNELQTLLRSKQTTESVLRENVSKCLRELLAEQFHQVGKICLNLEPQQSLPLHWDKFMEFRKQQGSEVDDLKISDGSLYFHLCTASDNIYYMVISFDESSYSDSLTETITEDHQHLEQQHIMYVTLPIFSLLQVRRPSTGAYSLVVQSFQRIPPLKKTDIYEQHHQQQSLNYERKQNKKRKLFEEEIFLKHILLTGLSKCTYRISIHQLFNEIRRLKSKLVYSGEALSGTTTNSIPMGGQVVQFALPNSPRYSPDPILVEEIRAYLRPFGGVEICIKEKQSCITLLNDMPKDVFLAHTTQHRVLEDGKIVFCYPSPSGFWYGKPSLEAPLENFLRDLLYQVKPLCSFIVKLEALMKKHDAFGSDSIAAETEGRYYLEKQDYFHTVLACLCPFNQIQRVILEYKHKSGFLLTCSNGMSHPLMNYIQAALNIHKSPGQLIEALERTTVPLCILAKLVESKLLSAKFRRQEDSTILNVLDKGGNNGKRGGKELKLGYIGKTGGKVMRLGYTSEKGILGDEKSFTPSALVLIPRSQDRIKFAYSNRCCVDVSFLENRMLSVKSSSFQNGVPVPSCINPMSVSHMHIKERFDSLFTEMSNL